MHGLQKVAFGHGTKIIGVKRSTGNRSAAEQPWIFNINLADAVILYVGDDLKVRPAKTLPELNS